MKRVHAAVRDLAERRGPSALTMEGIAAEAGVGKQTLYRSWPSVHAILFDALLAESVAAEDGEAEVSLLDVMDATGAELETEPRSSLLRMLAAAIQTDAAVAREFHERLFASQRAQIVRRVAAEGFAHPELVTELLLAPILSRWFLRLPRFTTAELRDHLESLRSLERP